MREDGKHHSSVIYVFLEGTRVPKTDHARHMESHMCILVARKRMSLVVSLHGRSDTLNSRKKEKKMNQ